MFFLVVKKEIGWLLAIITLTPMACVATSVGGFSNGLAFWGVLISIYVYLQYHDPQDFPTQAPVFADALKA